ncbi:probable ATP-dependent RNA helicase DDX56 [Watersipora subatra]|uniref:probable ATP-dependent RNA helicase DDX56 n=1 Tax=Watersipora subatra TaxID=2589382 RepID=UPI00355C87BD
MDPNEEPTLNFYEMGIDERILKAITKLNWGKPTLIQEKVIPLALEGKDILAKARTGTGKTACFMIPILQKLLEIKKTSKEQKIRALIMTPSKELCSQAYQSLQLLSAYCSQEIRGLDISPTLASQKALLMDQPDVVIGTPSRVLAHLKAGNMQLKDSLEMVVVDEADLVFSFGYDTDMKQLLTHLPKIYQALLMSATLSPDVKSIKRMVLHNPVTVKLEETSLPDASQLTQYHIKCEDEDKFLLLYTLVKLNLICGKSLVFVSSVDRCYKLKLFLGHVGIMACVLNPELPINSRCHIVDQFNTGMYDIIIASDESKLDSSASSKPVNKGKKVRSKSHRKDTEYGVARGIDFQFVSNVINFDFPSTPEEYIHRVGRTARGENQGAALSFVSIAEMERFEGIKEALANEYDDINSVFQPFNFRMEEIEGFRYRARDAYRATTSLAVRKARLGEIKHEMFTSDKLKTYFEENPRDKQVLRHDATRGLVKLQQHLKNVPDYIIPDTLKNSAGKKKKRPDHKYKGKKTATKTQKNYRKRKTDALQSLELSSSKRGVGGNKRRKMK